VSKTAARQAVERALQGARSSLTGWYRANCPECLARSGKADYKQALSINVRSGVFWCWKCGLKGRIANAPELPPEDPTQAAVAMEPPPGYVTLASPDGQGSIILEAARRYAAKRCPPHMWDATGIGACATGPYAGRVIIPIFDEDDRTWLGWVGRTWYPSDKAYTYPKGMNRGNMLYNPRALREDTDEPLLVVEGVFDAIWLWPNAVAVLGKASELQMEALATCNRPVVIVLDGDAWMEAYAMMQRLRLHGRVAGYVRLPPKLDPDEVPRDWLAEEVRRAY
jgi:hypothetical protein